MPTVDSKHVFMGIYGEPGIGKTRLIGSSPGKVMIIRPPVDHTDSIHAADKQRIEERVIRDGWNDMDNLVEELRHEGDKWDWVWVDSWSLLQDVTLDWELDVEVNQISRNPERRKFGPDQGVYGRNMYKIGAWMRNVIGPDLFNFGFTAHPAVLASPDLDEDGDPIEKLMPWIQGKNMSPKLCGYTNLMCFMEKSGGKGRRVLRSQSDMRYYAKDQFDAFGDDGLLWDPTMPKVIEAISASPGRAARPARKSSTTKKSGGAKVRRTTRRGGQ